MDGTAFTTTNHYLTGEIVAATATATACAAWLASYVRRQAVRRRERVTVPPVEAAQSPVEKLLLEGDYRGRSVKMTMAGSSLSILVRAANQGRVFAEFGSSDRAPYAWLTLLCRRRLAAVASHWSIAVRGRNIILSCQGVGEPERLWFALDVACDIADAVDNAGVSAPLR